MRSFNHNLLLKNLNQVTFPFISYVGQMRRRERDVTLDIAVNVSLFPISIVTFCRFIPWHLCIVKPHAIGSGSCLGDIGT